MGIFGNYRMYYIKEIALNVDIVLIELCNDFFFTKIEVDMRKWYKSEDTLLA